MSTPPPAPPPRELRPGDIDDGAPGWPAARMGQRRLARRLAYQASLAWARADALAPRVVHVGGNPWSGGGL